jgi:hypothetical protein
MFEIEKGTSLNSQILHLTEEEEYIDGHRFVTVNLPDDTKVWLKILSDSGDTGLYLVSGLNISSGININTEDEQLFNDLIVSNVLSNVKINDVQVNDFKPYDINMPRGLNGAITVHNDIINKYKSMLGI